jgi:hypothetical protein
MSDFVAFFPSRECLRAPASFSEFDSIFRGPLHADYVQSDVVHGAPVLLTRSFGRSPQLYAKKDGSGWVVVKGIIFDVYSKTSAVDLEELLDQILKEEPGDLNRYEGAFALAAWDSRKAQGWAVNDQASVLNLYYGEHNGGLYVTTNALSLARALGLRLDPHGVQEFLAKSVLFAPSTIFAGLRRVNVGEHVRYRAGKVFHSKHWHEYEPEADYRSIREAADAVIQVVADRLSRYGATASPVISDLTGGLDTRLLVNVADAAGLKPTVTVNGPAKSEDVLIAKQVAETMNWEIRHFDTDLLWTSEITPDMRRELIYRTNGELPFTAVYHHLLSRPLLGKDFNLHMIGTGGDLLRAFPWREVARIRYKFLAVKTLPPSLFSHNWLPSFGTQFRSRVEDICHEQPRARITQQLDAVFIWKMTSHSSLYLSALHNWLPSVAPLMSAGVIKTCIAIPWTMRIFDQIQRLAIRQLSPRTAGIAICGRDRHGTAEPIGIKNLHSAVCHSLGIVSRSVERRLLKGYITKHLPLKTPVTRGNVPFLTREFKQFLDPETMFSRAIYATDGLRMALSGSDVDWYARASLIVRLATIEELCRELGFKPESDFLTPATSGDISSATPS